MRGLALREFRVSEAFRVLTKELLIGLVNGIAIASVTSLGVYVWSRNVGLSLVMFLAMIISMIAASAAGAVIPVALVKPNRDPPTASSIILTTGDRHRRLLHLLGLATWFADSARCFIEQSSLLLAGIEDRARFHIQFEILVLANCARLSVACKTQPSSGSSWPPQSSSS